MAEDTSDDPSRPSRDIAFEGWGYWKGKVLDHRAENRIPEDTFPEEDTQREDEHPEDGLPANGVN